MKEKFVERLGISKTEVHRSLLIAKLTKKIKEAAKIHDIEKYVLLEFNGIEDKKLKKKIERQILIGEVRKRAELRRILKVGIARNGKVKKAVRGKASSNIPVGMSANAFVKGDEVSGEINGSGSETSKRA